jgi:hypothetical protein
MFASATNSDSTYHLVKILKIRTGIYAITATKQKEERKTSISRSSLSNVT